MIILSSGLLETLLLSSHLTWNICTCFYDLFWNCCIRQVRANWENVKKQVMLTAIRAKFEAYSTLRSLLLSTEGSILVESSQSDLFWGVSRDGVGLNQLGHILMDLREEFLRVPSNSVPNGHTNFSHLCHRIKPQL